MIRKNGIKGTKSGEIIQVLDLDYRTIGQSKLAILNQSDAFLRNLGLLFCVYMYEEI
ncbi:MAG: hypothetical protein PHI24_06105 [Desulfitobacteriaceae bacterium]|nr:hypothetical protein [Desulfitobacteriaceae bacterium]